MSAWHRTPRPWPTQTSRGPPHEAAHRLPPHRRIRQNFPCSSRSSESWRCDGSSRSKRASGHAPPYPQVTSTGDPSAPTQPSRTPPPRPSGQGAAKRTTGRAGYQPLGPLAQRTGRPHCPALWRQPAHQLTIKCSPVNWPLPIKQCEPDAAVTTAAASREGPAVNHATDEGGNAVWGDDAGFEVPTCMAVAERGRVGRS